MSYKIEDQTKEIWIKFKDEIIEWGIERLYEYKKISKNDLWLSIANLLGSKNIKFTLKESFKIMAVMIEWIKSSSDEELVNLLFA